MTSDAPKPLMVLGAGLMRTGTNSLMIALQQLLGGECYHMHKVIENPQHIPFWLAAVKKDPSDEEWREFFKNYRAAVDAPPVVFYRRLMEVYPEAKVILSVREPHGWFQSVSKTVANVPTSVGGAGSSENPMSLFPELGKAMMEKILGGIDMKDEEAMVKTFLRHTEEVKKCVPKEKLLIFEAKEGWGPLCEFLGVPVPNEPYPMTNTTDQFLEKMKQLKK